MTFTTPRKSVFQKAVLSIHEVCQSPALHTISNSLFLNRALRLHRLYQGYSLLCHQCYGISCLRNLPRCNPLYLFWFYYSLQVQYCNVSPCQQLNISSIKIRDVLLNQPSLFFIYKIHKLAVLFSRLFLCLDLNYIRCYPTDNMICCFCSDTERTK